MCYNVVTVIDYCVVEAIDCFCQNDIKLFKTFLVSDASLAASSNTSFNLVYLIVSSLGNSMLSYVP